MRCYLYKLPVYVDITPSQTAAFVDEPFEFGKQQHFSSKALRFRIIDI